MDDADLEAKKKACHAGTSGASGAAAALKPISMDCRRDGTGNTFFVPLPS